MLHVLGGGFIAVFTYALFRSFIVNRFVLLWILVASAGTVGIGWEWYYYPSAYDDTMTDLALNPIGALLAGMYYVFFYRGTD